MTVATPGNPTPRPLQDIINDWDRTIANADLPTLFQERVIERHTPEREIPDPVTLRTLRIQRLVDPRHTADTPIHPILVVQGEILVRVEDVNDKTKDPTALLKARGFVSNGLLTCRGCDCGSEIELPVVSFTNPDPNLTADDVRDAVDELLAIHVNASCEHVLSDGGMKNSLIGPALSDPPTRPKKARTSAGKGVVVAVIDTGIAQSVTDRTDAILKGVIPKSIAANDPRIDPLNAINMKEVPPVARLDLGAGHGTFVAGVIRQIAPAATIRVYRALDSDGIGSEAGIACAIVRAWRDGATIINLSLGQESYRDRPPVALQAALDMISDDVIVVAAAGNLPSTSPEQVAMRPHWPAAFRRVLAVGALEEDGSTAPWSRRGAWVDVSTIGKTIISSFVVGTEEPVDPNHPDPNPDTWPPTDVNPWAMWSGTSFSAPQIAGLLAAGCAPTRYAKRVKPRQALANLMNHGHWFEDKYGSLIPSPLLP